MPILIFPLFLAAASAFVPEGLLLKAYIPIFPSPANSISPLLLIAIVFSPTFPPNSSIIGVPNGCSLLVIPNIPIALFPATFILPWVFTLLPFTAYTPTPLSFTGTLPVSTSIDVPESAFISP